MRSLAVVVTALLLATPAPAIEEIAAADTAEVRFVDAAPRGPGVEARLAEIRRRIQAGLVYPPLARRQRIEGVTLVRFAIETDGAPRDVEVHRSSGVPSLDRAARRAVAGARPLPWVYGRLEVPVRFELEERR
jgi:protein TonB